MSHIPRIVSSISESRSETLVSPGKHSKAVFLCSLASRIYRNEGGFDEFREEREVSWDEDRRVVTHRKVSKRLRWDLDDNLKSCKKIKVNGDVSSNNNSIDDDDSDTDAPTILIFSETLDIGILYSLRQSSN